MTAHNSMVLKGKEVAEFAAEDSVLLKYSDGNTYIVSDWTGCFLCNRMPRNALVLALLTHLQVSLPPIAL